VEEVFSFWPKGQLYTIIFSKRVLPLNLRAENTKLRQKQIEKIEYFRNYGLKTIFDQPFGRQK
jgi:hypothetical protein